MMMDRKKEQTIINKRAIDARYRMEILEGNPRNSRKTKGYIQRQQVKSDPDDACNTLKQQIKTKKVRSEGETR